MALFRTLLALLLVVSAGARKFALTFHNPTDMPLAVYYMDSPLVEHKMGQINRRADLTHAVMAGQNFVVRSPNDDFRVMLQIDAKEPDEDAEYGFKITFIHMMGEAPSKALDIKYDGKTVGTARLLQPNTQGAYDHNLLSVFDGSKERLQVRAVYQGNDEL